MIFPILRGLVSFRAAPVTWAVILLNAICLVYTSFAHVGSQSKLGAAMRNAFFLQTQGRLYSHYIQETPASQTSPFLRELSQRVEEGDLDATDTLGDLAFRDNAFYEETDQPPEGGDPVAFKYWRETSGEVRALEELPPSFALGLNTDEFSVSRWISYMFVHSGFMHFAGNMLFLAIFGAALEAQIGGVAFLATYVLFGMCAAGAFALITGVSGTPLVGASGAISGTMAFYGALNWRRPVRYFYWFFLPVRGYIGIIYLPASVAFVFALAADLAGWAATIPEMGGVAHTAHLGGDVAGLIAALTLLGLRRFRPITSEPLPTPVPVPMTLLPFFPPAQNRAA